MKTMKDHAEKTLRELVKRYLADPSSLTEEESRRMSHCARVASEGEPDPFDPSGEDPVDLFGPWWE